MNIFLSWSGELSQQLAACLHDWLETMMPGTEPFVSSEDLRKGSQWPVELARHLERANFGIICLTRSNLESTWLSFEAGALSKALDKAHVCTLLFDGLLPNAVKGPLSNFQHTHFRRDDFKRLVFLINDLLGASKRKSENLEVAFQKFWPDLEESIKAIVENSSDISLELPTRSNEDLLSEVLERIKSLEREVASNNEEALRRLSENGPTNTATNPITPYANWNPGDLEHIWSHATQQVRTKRPLLTAWLHIGKPLAIVGDYLIVLYPNDQRMSVESLARANTRKFIGELLSAAWTTPLHFIPLVAPKL